MQFQSGRRLQILPLGKNRLLNERKSDIIPKKEKFRGTDGKNYRSDYKKANEAVRDVSDEKNIKNPEKNYAAEGCEVKCFLALKNGKIVGRVAGIIVEESNRKYNEKKIRFSRFDFIDDEEVCSALLNAVENFGRERGMEFHHGPWGFNDTYRVGMLTYG